LVDECKLSSICAKKKGHLPITSTARKRITALLNLIGEKFMGQYRNVCWHQTIYKTKIM